MQFDLLRPKDLSADEWRRLQALERIAFMSQLPNRTEAEIDHFVNWDRPEQFYGSRIDPNREVGKRFNENQSYHAPRVVVAMDSNDIVGSGYAANNVSGNRAQRAMKRLDVTHRYLWVREMAVHPDYQRRGLGRHMLGNLALSGHIAQPMSAYVWIDEIPFVVEGLYKAGFEPRGKPRAVHVFGEDEPPVLQAAMFAPSTTEVAINLAR